MHALLKPISGEDSQTRQHFVQELISQGWEGKTKQQDAFQSNAKER